ncbi:MAG: SEL1-like repeat protein [Polyangiaceae bacterium]
MRGQSTTWAVLIGASAGALIAVTGPGRAPAPAELPFAPIASLGHVRRPIASVQEPASPATASAPAAVIALPAPSANSETLSLGCARRQAVACLARAELAERDADEETATLYYRLATQQLAQQCMARRGGACALLSDLYHRGRGVKQDVATAEALRTRAAELCAQRPGDGCPAVVR